MIIFIFGAVVFVLTFTVASIGRLRDNYVYNRAKPEFDFNEFNFTKPTKPEFRPTEETKQ